MLMYEIWSLGHKPFEDVTNPKVQSLTIDMTVHLKESWNYEYFAHVNQACML